MELESKSVELTEQLNHWEQAYESLEGQLKEKDSLLTKTSKEAEELRLQLSDALQELRELVDVNDEVGELSRKLMFAERKRAEYEEGLIAATNTVDEMNAAIGVLTDSNRSQESAYNQVVLELKDAKARSSYLQNKCDEMEKQVRDSNTALAELQEQKSSLESESKLASKESERHQSMVLEQLGQIESLASERIRKVKQEVEETLARTYGLQIMELQAKIEELEGDNAKLLSELSSTTSKLENCTKELEALRLKDASSVSSEQYKQLEDRCEDLQRRIGRSDSEHRLVVVVVVL